MSQTSCTCWAWLFLLFGLVWHYSRRWQLRRTTGCFSKTLPLPSSFAGIIETAGCFSKTLPLPSSFAGIIETTGCFSKTLPLPISLAGVGGTTGVFS